MTPIELTLDLIAGFEERCDRLELFLDRAEEPVLDLDDAEPETPEAGTPRLVWLPTGLRRPTSSCCSSLVDSLLEILVASSCIINSAPSVVTPGNIPLSALIRMLGNSTAASEGTGGKAIEGGLSKRV
jgi:hypothetical protein